MATKLFFRNEAADTHLGTNNASTVTGVTTAWNPKSLSLTQGTSATASDAQNTAAGPVDPAEYGSGGVNCEFISPPVSAGVTISGTITANIWAAESNMSANVAVEVVIDIIRANDLTGQGGSNALQRIVLSTNTVEVAVTTRAANNFTTGMTSGAYTAQTINRGDRIRARICSDDAGTMGAGFTSNVSWGGPAGADGDSFISFTETITFESAPSGTTIYLTDVTSDVSTSSVDREAWTSRGSGVLTDVTNTVAGWTNPIQVTDTAGGTTVDWYSRQLQAVTLAGLATGNLRGLESTISANTSLRCEISVVNSDGTSPTLWCSWCISASAPELTTSETAVTANLSGGSLSVSNGQRLRIRILIDDNPDGQMGSANTATTYYNGTSGGASGDTYIIFPQTLAEFISSVAYTVLNGSDAQLVNVNAGGTDVDALSYKDGVLLSQTELATLLDGSTFGHKDVAVIADLTGDAATYQRKRAAMDLGALDPSS